MALGSDPHSSSSPAEGVSACSFVSECRFLNGGVWKLACVDAVRAVEAVSDAGGGAPLKLEVRRSTGNI